MITDSSTIHRMLRTINVDVHHKNRFGIVNRLMVSTLDRHQHYPISCGTNMCQWWRSLVPIHISTCHRTYGCFIPMVTKIYKTSCNNPYATPSTHLNTVFLVSTSSNETSIIYNNQPSMENNIHTQAEQHFTHKPNNISLHGPNNIAHTSRATFIFWG